MGCLSKKRLWMKTYSGVLKPTHNTTMANLENAYALSYIQLGGQMTCTFGMPVRK